METAGDVRHARDDRPAVGQLDRGDGTDFAEALDDAAPAGKIPPSRARAAITITTPAPVASARKTEPPIEIGLPVTISGTAWPDLHRVGVHHPGHRLLVRRHVGRRDVLLRADDREQLGGEAAGHAPGARARERARIAPDAALRPAVGKPQQRALPGHPHRQRRALAQRDVGVVPHPALRRAEDARVLDAIAGEDGPAAVVELHRDATISERSGTLSRSATASPTSAWGTPARPGRVRCGRAASPTRAAGAHRKPAARPDTRGSVRRRTPRGSRNAAKVPILQCKEGAE